MGCSGRQHYKDIRPEQKWDFISLGDFKSTSCFPPFAYAYLWGSLVVSVAVYGVDTFTAVQLLVFNQWTSIEPKIPLLYTKWIFSSCIILSWLNLGYEYFRAIRVMRREAVAESYLDSLAVRLECIRMGSKGRGWRRFLVFAELTKSKKGAEYVALFTYFSFQAWIRIIFCSGPRQVVNAVTLLAVYQTNLDPKVADAGTSILQFFKNIGILADADKKQAVILSGMLFTLVIWVFAVLSLILAVLFYLLFLWHYIPNSDGGLSAYCRRKIDSRLTRIVSAKVNKALEDEERKRLKLAQKQIKKGEAPIVPIGSQATLPNLFDAKTDDKLPEMPMLHRNDTMATLPAYTSRPGSPSRQQPAVPGFELSSMDQRRPYPQRSDTGVSAMSNTSYASNAPLMGAAGEMGYGRGGSPVPTVPTLPQLDNDGFPFPQRSTTANSNGSQWQRGTPQPMNNSPFGPPSRQMTQELPYPDDSRGPPSRQMTQDMYSPDGRGTPSRQLTATPGTYADPRGPPSRQMTQDSFSNPRGPPSRQMTQDNFTPSPISYNDTGRNSPRPQPSTIDSYGRPLPPTGDALNGRVTPVGASIARRPVFGEMPGGRSSPAPMQNTGRSTPAAHSQVGSISMASEADSYHSGQLSPVSANGSSSGAHGGYTAYNPTQRSASAAIPNQPQQQRPYRNMTEPMPPPIRQGTGDYFNNAPPSRQGTPQGQYVAYGGGNDPRAASPATFGGRPGPPPPQQPGQYRR